MAPALPQHFEAWRDVVIQQRAAGAADKTITCRDDILTRDFACRDLDIKALEMEGAVRTWHGVLLRERGRILKGRPAQDSKLAGALRAGFINCGKDIVSLDFYQCFRAWHAVSHCIVTQPSRARRASLHCTSGTAGVGPTTMQIQLASACNGGPTPGDFRSVSRDGWATLYGRFAPPNTSEVAEEALTAMWYQLSAAVDRRPAWADLSDSSDGRHEGAGDDDYQMIDLISSSADGRGVAGDDGDWSTFLLGASHRELLSSPVDLPPSWPASCAGPNDDVCREVSVVGDGDAWQYSREEAMDFVLQRVEDVSAASLATHVWERHRGAMLCSKGSTHPGDALREVARLHEVSVAVWRRS